jgi:hypothetical protein
VSLPLPRQIRAGLAHLGRGDAGVGAQCPHQVIDPSGRDSVQVGLHHREPRLIDPPPTSQQRGKDDPARSLGIRRSRFPAVVVSVRGREPLRWAVRASLRSWRCHADHRDQLGLDQSLLGRGRRRSNLVVDIGGLQCFQHLEQGGPVQGRRVLCPSARTIGVVSLTITRWRFARDHPRGQWPDVDGKPSARPGTRARRRRCPGPRAGATSGPFPSRDQ